jgi:hypothetical protein
MLSTALPNTAEEMHAPLADHSSNSHLSAIHCDELICSQGIEIASLIWPCYLLGDVPYKLTVDKS